MKPDQPRKPVSEVFNRLEFLREAESIHKRINDLIINPSVAALANTKANYVAADVGTAADIATALNAIASALNTNTAAVNALLGKLNAS